MHPETLVNFNMTTWHYILKDSKLHIRHRENLKSHIIANLSIPQHSIHAGKLCSKMYDHHCYSIVTY
jgi:hypothetical protein